MRNVSRAWAYETDLAAGVELALCLSSVIIILLRTDII